LSYLHSADDFNEENGVGLTVLDVAKLSMLTNFHPYRSQSAEYVWFNISS
jgi:hypothetical protein